MFLIAATLCVLLPTLQVFFSRCLLHTARLLFLVTSAFPQSTIQLFEQALQFGLPLCGFVFRHVIHGKCIALLREQELDTLAFALLV